MKAMNGDGPGGRVARANKRLGKAVSKLPASRDTPIERREKMASIDKTKATVAKRVDKLTKVVGKAANKSIKVAAKVDEKKPFQRTGRLSDLDRFEKPTKNKMK